MKFCFRKFFLATLLTFLTVSCLTSKKSEAATLSFDVYSGYNWYYGGPQNPPICDFQGYITTCIAGPPNRQYRHADTGCRPSGGINAEGTVYLLACLNDNCARRGSDDIDFGKTCLAGSPPSCEAEIRASYDLSYANYSATPTDPGPGGRTNPVLSTTSGSTFGFKVVMNQTSPASSAYQNCINANSSPTFGISSGAREDRNYVYTWNGLTDVVHTVYFTWLFKAPWFSTNLGGILSGKTNGFGISEVIAPDTAAGFPFKEVVVQGSTTSPPQEKSEYGMLLTAEDFSVRGPSGATYDAFATYIGPLDVLDPSVYIGSSDLSSYTKIDTSGCPSGNFLRNNSLSPETLFYRVGLTCAQSAFNDLSASQKYNLHSLPGNPGGVVVLFVEATSTDTLTLSQPVIAQNYASERIILVTPAKVVVGSDVGSSIPYSPGATANIQMAIITAADFSLQNSSSGNALIAEGPIIVGDSVRLYRTVSSTTYPGVLISYNPIYLELFRTTLNSYLSNSGVSVPLMLSRKVRWAND